MSDGGRWSLLEGALGDVEREVRRQERIWGPQDHAFSVWLAVLTEEVGELAERVVEMELGDGPGSDVLGDAYEEAVQVAAVAAQVAATCLRRLEELE